MSNPNDFVLVQKDANDASFAPLREGLEAAIQMLRNYEAASVVVVAARARGKDSTARTWTASWAGMPERRVFMSPLTIIGIDPETGKAATLEWPGSTGFETIAPR